MSWKTPAEIGYLLEDMRQVFGSEVAERNRGWFYRIAKTLDDSWIHESLSWVHQTLMEAECSGPEIRSASAHIHDLLFQNRLAAPFADRSLR